MSTFSETIAKSIKEGSLPAASIEGLLNQQINSNIRRGRKHFQRSAVVRHWNPSKEGKLESSPGNWALEFVNTTVAPFSGNPLCYASSGFYQNYYLDQQFVLGYFNMASTPYIGPNTCVVFQMDANNWNTTYWGPPITTVRQILPVLQGQVPVIEVPSNLTPEQMQPGLIWEQTCLTMGWWNQDPPGVTDPTQIPPGPNYGHALLPPNITLAVWALLNNLPNWWEY